MRQYVIKFYSTDVYPSSGGDDAAIIAGSSQIASSAMGVMATANLNKQTENFDLNMYNREVAQNQANWNEQNAYNAPAAQMQRFKAAGLNPNLIYGQGNPGNAGVVSSVTAPAWNPKAPDYSGFASALGNAYNIKTQQAQLNNINAQNQVIMADAQLKQSQKANTDADTQNKTAALPGFQIDQNLKQFDLNLKNALQPITIALATDNEEQARANIANTLSSTDVMLSRNDREAAMNAVNIKQGLQNILESRQRVLQSQVQTLDVQADIQKISAQMKQINANTTLDNLDIQLKRLGIEPGDNMFMRILGRAATSGGLLDNLSQGDNIGKFPPPADGSYMYP